jgi:hypothetical protein
MATKTTGNSPESSRQAQDDAFKNDLSEYGSRKARRKAAKDLRNVGREARDTARQGIQDAQNIAEEAGLGKDGNLKNFDPSKQGGAPEAPSPVSITPGEHPGDEYSSGGVLKDLENQQAGKHPGGAEDQTKPPISAKPGEFPGDENSSKGLLGDLEKVNSKGDKDDKGKAKQSLNPNLSPTNALGAVVVPAGTIALHFIGGPRQSNAAPRPPKPVINMPTTREASIGGTYAGNTRDGVAVGNGLLSDGAISKIDYNVDGPAVHNGQGERNVSLLSNTSQRGAWGAALRLLSPAWSPDAVNLARGIRGGIGFADRGFFYNRNRAGERREEREDLEGVVPDDIVEQLARVTTNQMRDRVAWSRARATTARRAYRPLVRAVGPAINRAENVRLRILRHTWAGIERVAGTVERVSETRYRSHYRRGQADMAHSASSRRHNNQYYGSPRYQEVRQRRAEREARRLAGGRPVTPAETQAQMEYGGRHHRGERRMTDWKQRAEVWRSSAEVQRELADRIAGIQRENRLNTVRGTRPGRIYTGTRRRIATSRAWPGNW